MSDSALDRSWFAVRTIIRFPSEIEGVGAYEERITLWHATSFDEAMERAEADAWAYAEGHDGEPVGVAQAYETDAAPAGPRDGDELFSLIRHSSLEPDDYVDRFFDTGDENQGRLDD